MNVKGYLTPNGYFGCINGEYQLYPTEEEYLDALLEETTNDSKNTERKVRPTISDFDRRDHEFPLVSATGAVVETYFRKSLPIF